jgi:Ca2+-binding RTX toxin-like protein
VESGILTEVAIIKAGDIAYQFREMLIIPEVEGDELDSLDEVLKVILAGNDRIIGSDRADTLIGLTGGDRLDGHRGDDVLIGGAGADRLSGGGGSDTFVVDILPTSGRRADTIKDFNPEKDQIALDHLVFTEIGNRLSPREFHVGTEATHKSDRIIYNDETGALFFDGDGKGKADQVKLAMLDPGLDLKAGDFLIL